MTTRPRRPAGSELSSALAAFRGVFLAIGGFSCAINLLMLVPTLYMLQIYDRVLASRNETTLLMLTLIVVGLYVLEPPSNWFARRAMIRAQRRARPAARRPVCSTPRSRRYMDARTGNPGQALGRPDQHPPVPHRQGTVRVLRRAVDADLHRGDLRAASVAGRLRAGSACCCSCRWRWLNEVATAVPLAAPTASRSRRRTTPTGHLRNAEAIHAMGMLPSLRAAGRSGRTVSRAAGRRKRPRGRRSARLTRFARITFQSAILGLGALLVLDGQLSPGGMIAASILLGRALAPWTTP